MVAKAKPKSKIAEVIPLRTFDASSALKVLEDLRARVASGEVSAFAVAGVKSDGGVFTWTSSTRMVSNTLMIGAVAMLQSDLIQDAG